MAIKIMDSFEPAGSGFKVVDAKDISVSNNPEQNVKYDLTYALKIIGYLLGLTTDTTGLDTYLEEHRENSAKSVAEIENKIDNDILDLLKNIVGDGDSTNVTNRTLKDLKDDITTVDGEITYDGKRYIRLTKDFGKHKVDGRGYVDVEIDDNQNITDVILSAFRDVETEYSDLITEPSISLSYPSSINVEYGDHTASIPFSITINKGKYKYGAIDSAGETYTDEDSDDNSIGIDYNATVYDEVSLTNYNVSYTINDVAIVRKTINNSSRKLESSISISNYIVGYGNIGITSGTSCPISAISYKLTYILSDNGKNARYALNNLGLKSDERIEKTLITHGGSSCNIVVYKPIFYGYFTDSSILINLSGVSSDNAGYTNTKAIFDDIKNLRANLDSGKAIRNISGITKTNNSTRPTLLVTTAGMKYILMLFPSDNAPSTVTFTNTSNGSGLDVKTAAHNINIKTIDGKRDVSYKAFYVSNPSATGNANTYNITYT